MSIEDLLKIAETVDKNTGWFLEFLGYFVAIGLVATFIVHFYRYATGQSDWLGRSTDDNSQITQIQLDSIRKDKEEVDRKLVQLETEIQDLLEILKEKEAEIDEKNQELMDTIHEMEALKGLYEELDSKYDDETYATSQIMYTVEEVAAALANEGNFKRNRGDIYINLLDYLINTIKGFREKNPRVVIHIKHPERDDVLMHYAHSSGHSHRVKDYHPPIEGSAAGRAWQTNELYYVPDVEDPQYEYHRKEQSNKYYRTILCVPLKAGTDKSTRIGVLSITGKPVDAYEKIEIERVMLFASLLYPLIYMDTKIREVSTYG
ncbi:GAF domain-containing protein [Paenactinomyces guangxiensis]|uniref:GAF domain-containing protein n=1 Tax=Paenactinomyces guangxiensis TaxID=1490290 RepID=A0A7W1WUM0_9BACL|nr:GAF domain-containing protein [Paenactinomyces guangxiensis]MBA4496373.1 hypothetical protein [Paenactinomyces guangxiensis]MBH8593514.1 hypothetical protein [Paenactinomyces guangxiensis]